jgi:hypothetical protein
MMAVVEVGVVGMPVDHRLVGGCVGFARRIFWPVGMAVVLVVAGQVLVIERFVVLG